MADENLKDFTVNWALFGLLLTCLLTFTIFFIAENNPTGLGDEATYILNDTNNNLESNLYEIDADSNELLNITSKTNPETSFLGSRDSVATSYKMKESGRSYWSSTKLLISWILTGDVGKILLSVFGGLIGFASVYFIIKFIRQGS